MANDSLSDEQLNVVRQLVGDDLLEVDLIELTRSHFALRAQLDGMRSQLMTKRGIDGVAGD